MSCFVYDLGAGIQLRVVPRHSFDNFACADQCTLLAVKKLRKHPLATLNTELKPFFVAPCCKFCIGIPTWVYTVTNCGLIGSNSLFDVNCCVPRQIGCAIPLTGLGFLIKFAQWRSGQRIIPGENCVSVIFYSVLNFVCWCHRNAEDRFNIIDLISTDNVLILLFCD